MELAEEIAGLSQLIEEEKSALAKKDSKIDDLSKENEKLSRAIKLSKGLDDLGKVVEILRGRLDVGIHRKVDFECELDGMNEGAS